MAYRITYDPTDGAAASAAGIWNFAIFSNFYNIPLSFSCFVKVEHQYKFTGNDVISVPMFITNSGTGVYASIRYTKSSGGIGTSYSNGTTTYYRQLNFGVWQHICFVWASSTSRLLYLDGIRVASESGLFSGVNMDYMQVGDQTNGFTTNGLQVAEFTMFNRALSAGEVFQLSKGETNGLRKQYSFSMTQPYMTTGFPSASGVITFGQNKGGQLISTNDSPLYTRPTSILGQFASRRRLFVVS